MFSHLTLFNVCDLASININLMTQSNDSFIYLKCILNQSLRIALAGLGEYSDVGLQLPENK